MPFAYFRVEKTGAHRQHVWTPRVIAIDIRRGHVYYSAEISPDDDGSAPADRAWKRKFKLDKITLSADRAAVDVTDPHFDPRELFTISLEGVMRRLTPQDSGRDGPNIISALGNQRENISAIAPSRCSMLSPLDEVIWKYRTTCTVRCDEYEEFMRLFAVARNVLVMSGHMPPVHFGLPPHDPRNGLTFPLVPLHLRCALRILQNAVFYELLYGQLVFMSASQGGRPLALKGYLCITPEMIVVMRPDATVPRWLTLDRIAAVHYQANPSNSTESRGPFIAILARGTGADILFEPLPPLFPPSVRDAFRASTAVGCVRHILETLLPFAAAAAKGHGAEPTAAATTGAPYSGTTTRADPLRNKNKAEDEPYGFVEHPDCPHVLAFIERGASIASRPLRWTVDSDSAGTLRSFVHKEVLAATLCIETGGEHKVRQVESADVSDPVKVVVPQARETNSPARQTFIGTWSVDDDEFSRQPIRSTAADSAIVFSEEQLQSEEDEAFPVSASLNMLMEPSAAGNGSFISIGGSGSMHNDVEVDSFLGTSISSEDLLSSSML